MNIHSLLTKNILIKQIPVAARVNDPQRIPNVLAIVKAKSNDSQKISK
jgi:hypothetical protein